MCSNADALAMQIMLHLDYTGGSIFQGPLYYMRKLAYDFENLREYILIAFLPCKVHGWRRLLFRMLIGGCSLSFCRFQAYRYRRSFAERTGNGNLAF